MYLGLRIDRPCVDVYNICVGSMHLCACMLEYMNGIGCRIADAYVSVGTDTSVCVLYIPPIPNFTSPSSPSSLAVTGLGAPLSRSVLKRRYISLQNE